MHCNGSLQGASNSNGAADLLLKAPSQGTENDSLGLDQRAIMQELAVSR